jgi:hypothetical protein
MEKERTGGRDGGVSINSTVEAFRQLLENKENERNRHHRWISNNNNVSGQSIPLSSRAALVDRSNNSSADAARSNNQQNSRSITSISSPAKRNLWLLGQRYSSTTFSSSSTTTADAQSVISDNQSSSSVVEPTSPPSLRDSRQRSATEGTSFTPPFSPIHMLLLHASRRDNNQSVSDVELEKEEGSTNGEYETPVVQGGYLLQLLNQLARSSNDDVHPQPQSTQSSPSPPPGQNLNETMSSTDEDDDGSSMLSNVSSFISSAQLYSSADKEKSVSGRRCHEHDVVEEQESEMGYFSSFCKVQTMLSKLERDENSPQKRRGGKTKNNNSNSLPNEEDNVDDWGLIRSIAFISILVVVSILLTCSGLSLLQAVVYTRFDFDSLQMQFWERIEDYETICLTKFNELYMLQSSMLMLLYNWSDSVTAHFFEVLGRCEALYLDVMNDLFHHLRQISSLLSWSNLTSLVTQQLKLLGEYVSSLVRSVDVTSVVLEQLYRIAKAYYSAVNFFKSTQSSVLELQTSTALAWNTTLLMGASYLNQVKVTVFEAKTWLVTPLSYSVHEQHLIGKASLTAPILFDVGTDLRWKNNTAPDRKEMSQIITPRQFWRRRSRAFLVKPALLIPETTPLLLSSSSGSQHFENVGHSTTVVGENLTSMVVMRMRNTKHEPKQKKPRRIRDYYNSLITQEVSAEEDVFDGVDVMSMASDAIIRWWRKNW